MHPPADCLRCGVCCFSNSPTFVRVSGDDWSRLGPEAERLAHFVGPGHRAFMRMRDGHCAALELRPLAAADAGGSAQVEYFCTIYERRPQICRDLARGSPECDGERMAKAERPVPDAARTTLPLKSSVP
jgi:Fe-S-cluster containining protein